jgi:hypothetical protein
MSGRNRRTPTLALLGVALLALLVGAAQARAGNGQVAIYGPSVMTGMLPDPKASPTEGGTVPLVSLEQYVAEIAPLSDNVVVLTEAQWRGMTRADFAQYDALVFGGNGCGHQVDQALLDTRSAWGPAVTGNVIAIGTDPARNYFNNGTPYANVLYITQGAVDFAATGSGTGLYAALNCFYSAAPAGTPVPLLDPFGSFTAHGVCSNDTQLLESAPPFDLWSSYALSLSSDGCAAHEVFDGLPDGFVALANAAGTPFVVARGYESPPPPPPPDNTAPVAVDDAYTVSQDQQLDVDAASGVLANDSDAQLDTLSASIADAPTHGAVTLADDGSFTYVPDAGFVGVDSFTYAASDGQLSSDPATVQITVADTEAPQITCPANSTQSTDPGKATAVVSYTVDAADNSGNVSVDASPASGSAFAIGTTTVHATATDGTGHTASCSFTVTVVDDEAPAISCPANSTQSTDPGKATAVVSFTVDAADNSGNVSVDASPASGSAFAIGTTTVHATATDEAGHTASCSFTVTVVDDEAPAITCPANITKLADPGQASATASYAATATDNAPGVTTSLTPPSGSTFPVGTTTVTATATDTAGHTASCTFTVSVTKRPTTLVYTGPTTAASGTTVSLTARLTDTTLATALAGKTVRFSVDGGAPQSATTNASGVPTVSVTPTAGPHTIAVSYAGDAGTLASSADGSLVVSSPTSRGATGEIVGYDVRPAAGGSAWLLIEVSRGHVEGGFTYTSPTGTRVVSRRIDSVVFGNNGGSATISGALFDGRSFVLYLVEGNARSGMFDLRINGVAQTGSGALRSGSIWISGRN